MQVTTEESMSSENKSKPLPARARYSGTSPYPHTSANSSSAFKLIILDEADAMTLQAQNALRRSPSSPPKSMLIVVIEKYTRNVRFCIICNYINKLSPAIQSRTTKFRFSPLSTPSISARLDHIIDAESVNITSAGKEALLKLSQGDMRRAVNVIQACASAYDTIDEEEVYMCVGMIMPVDTERIVQSMLSEELGTCLKSKPLQTRRWGN
jgi:replication factor C subunit 3/5